MGRWAGGRRGSGWMSAAKWVLLGKWVLASRWEGGQVLPALTRWFSLLWVGWPVRPCRSCTSAEQRGSRATRVKGVRRSVPASSSTEAPAVAASLRHGLTAGAAPNCRCPSSGGYPPAAHLNKAAALGGRRLGFRGSVDIRDACRFGGGHTGLHVLLCEVDGRARCLQQGTWWRWRVRGAALHGG